MAPHEPEPEPLAPLIPRIEGCEYPTDPFASVPPLECPHYHPRISSALFQGSSACLKAFQSLGLEYRAMEPSGCRLSYILRLRPTSRDRPHAIFPTVARHSLHFPTTSYGSRHLMSSPRLVRVNLHSILYLTGTFQEKVYPSGTNSCARTTTTNILLLSFLVRM